MNKLELIGLTNIKELTFKTAETLGLDKTQQLYCFLFYINLMQTYEYPNEYMTDNLIDYADEFNRAYNISAEDFLASNY